MPVHTGFWEGTPTDIQTYNQLPPVKIQSFEMVITEGAKIGHTTSQLRPSFCFLVSLLTTITKNCAGQWLGQTRFACVCVWVLTLHRCVHALHVFVCVLYISVCVLSVMQHPGAVEYQWRSLGLCLCPDHCAEEWRGKKEVKSMASEGWLAGNSKLHLHNKWQSAFVCHGPWWRLLETANQE